MPHIEGIISYIKSEMDEMEREEFFRVKKVRRPLSSATLPSVHNVPVLSDDAKANVPTSASPNDGNFEWRAFETLHKALYTE